jgi:pimeloyl-ACP methyl ester carboxylesterase
MHDASECVILLHGLGRFRQSMRGIERHLKSLGYSTINLPFPSTTATIEAIAEKYVAPAVVSCEANHVRRIHFVGHSLGGIIVRQYLQQHSVPAGSRLVMLAPPNQGLALVDLLRRVPLYEWLAGPASGEIGTGPGSVVHRLKPVPVEIGVIAGNRSMNLLFSAFMEGADDGRITVESTKLPEMADFIVVPSTHTAIVRDPLAILQTAHFIRFGKFDHTGKG